MADYLTEAESTTDMQTSGMQNGSSPITEISRHWHSRHSLDLRWLQETDGMAGVYNPLSANHVCRT